MDAAQADLSGRLVTAAESVSKSFEGRPIVRKFSVRVLQGDRVGIIGPNGAGKTTLLNLLTATSEPDAGEIRLGTNFEVVILDQRRETLDPAETLRHALTGGAGDTPVGVRSGGESGRLTLARAFAETLDVLQERLAEYRGTVPLVSHDRDFLDRVMTSVIAPESAAGAGSSTPAATRT